MMSRHGLFLSAVLCSLFSDGVKSDGRIVDLSLDFEVGNLNNPGALLIEQDIVAKVPETRRLLVLDNGKIVANYTRADVDPNELYSIFAVQQGIDSLLFGLAIDSGEISYEDTLGDIFPDDSTWSNVSDVSHKKSVTIYELLTMTSGLDLIKKPVPCCFDPRILTDPSFCSACSDVTGKNVNEALSLLIVNATRGQYENLDGTIIYSYILKAKTGKTPRELLSTKVLPELGIKNTDISWRQNSEGMDLSTAGLYLTAEQMAKFGQLFLQRGFSAPHKSTLSSKWTDKSTSKLVEIQPNGKYGFYWFGFWWYIYNGCTVGNNHVGEYYCTFGIVSQAICIHPKLNRVFVRQSDCPLPGCAIDPKFLDVAIFSPSTSFDAKHSKAAKLGKQSKAVCELIEGIV